MLHMGTIATGRLQDYWKTTRLFSIPFFFKINEQRIGILARAAYSRLGPLLNISIIK
jgi:hypothetical protein